jgi:amino acid transporter
MAQAAATENTSVPQKLKREITLLPLFALIYFTVCGGAFGIESLIGLSGPLMALILIAITPIVFSIPNMLMVREMTSMMPAEGGYYHWVKQAFGRFAGFMAGWMNWVVSWVDVTIYPVLAASYISYFFPFLRQDIILGSITIPAWVLQWLVTLTIIWAITALNIRGARLVGLTANWIGIIMIIPLILLSIFGIYNWIRSGTTISLPLLSSGETSWNGIISSLSVGLFVVMWNYMGWELPTAAGDEIVNPKRTYPLAMALVLVATIATYALPILGGLYGGAGSDGRYVLWGQEENEMGQGIGVVLTEEYGVTEEQMTRWGIDKSREFGWQFPEIAHAIGEETTGQKNSGLARFLGSSVTLAAFLSMLGLFIGNGLGGTRIPFAMAKDGMMPQWLTKIHPKFGTPWVSILFCGIVFSIFSLQAFERLVVIDVFLNMLVLFMQLLALWRLRFTLPNVPRSAVPGGYLGLFLITLGPSFFIFFAIYSQFIEEGINSIIWALGAMAIGALLYFPILKYVKPGIPDVNPFEASQDEE